jgi:predicted phage-related endonuclease
VAETQGEKIVRLEQNYEHLIEKIDDQKKQITNLATDVKELTTLLQNAKGGWRVLLIISGIAATFGVTATQVAYFFFKIPLPK